MRFSTASLQDLCLREVINNLEYYPPELLACLPPTLRHPLLVHMPIVDLCQLENTCVFDGVDAEMIWRERYEQQTLKYTSLIANRRNVRYCGLTRRHLCIVRDPERLLDRYKTMREKYFATIIFSIFECARPTGYYRCDNNEAAPLGLSTFGDINLKRCGLLDHPVDIVNYLVAAVKINRVLVTREPSDDSIFTNPKQIHFDRPVAEFELLQHAMSIPSGPLQYLAYMATNELYQEVPPRYSSFLNEECRLSEEDALMLLMDKCDYYAGDLYINVVRCSVIRWNWKDDRIRSLIGRFFSKVFKLELCCYSNGDNTDAVICPLKDITKAILFSSSVQLFSLTILEPTEDHINAIAPLLSNPNAPCRLEELRLNHISLPTVDSANTLCDILSFQVKLSSLEMYSLEGGITGSRFVTSIIDLLRRPCFKYLSLENFILGFPGSNGLKALITTFLTTPCSQAKSVQLRDLQLTESCNDDLGQQNLDIPQSTLKYKSLYIDIPLSSDVYSWLFSLRPLKLKSLCVSGVNRSTLALAAHHTSLYVSHLNLEITESDFPTEDFHTLLQNESLKELIVLPHGQVGLCDITRGLVIIGEKGTLEALTVDSISHRSTYRIYGSVKASNKAEVEDFGEALFSLPQLNHFSLELSIATLADQDFHMADFIETLFKSWQSRKNKGQQKLKRFLLNFTISTTLDENLQSMTKEIGMEVKIDSVANECVCM